MKTIQLSKLKPKGISLKKIKHKKRLLFILILVIIVGIIVVNMNKPQDKLVKDYSELKREDMVKNIDTIGKIESNNKVNVYSTVNNVIKEVKVSAGDKVKAGDVLCILDSSALEKEIAETDADLKFNKEKSKVDIEGKRQAYDNAVNNVNTAIKDSESAIKTAEIKLDDAKRDYDNQKALYESGVVEKEKLNQAESALKTAQAEYDKSMVDLENAKVKAQNEVDAAKNSYNAAVVENSNGKAEVALQNKKDELSKCVITAPASGTVTTVNASVGNPASGILFTIEDLDDVIVTADIKEIDVNKIQPGQEVEITTDATDDGDFAAGKIVSMSDIVKGQGVEIHAAAGGNAANAGGGAGQSSSSTFEAKITLDNPTANDTVKAGMSAKAKIILDKRENVFTVPFSSILEEDDGKYIYTLVEADEGKYQVKKVQIKTGLESDVAVEINGEELNEDAKFVTDPTSFKDGELVLLAPSDGGNENE